MGIMRSATPVIQQVSVDEAYLDFTEQFDRWSEVPPAIENLRRRIRRDIGLTVSAGLGTGKLIAKIASDFDKPDGMTVVKPGREQSFLDPLAVGKIPGIGPKSVERLKQLKVERVADLRAMSKLELSRHFGKWGRDMYQWARGIDNRSVIEEHETKSISTERTFSEDIADETELKAIIRKLSSQVARQLTREKFRGRTVSIKVRYADFTTFTRQKSLGIYTDDEAIIAGQAVKLLEKSWTAGSPLRLLGVGISNFQQPDYQISLDF